MRTIEKARTSWQSLQNLPNVDAFRDWVKDIEAAKPLGSRSVYWKVFLLFDSCDQSQWLRKVGDSRSAYVSLRSHLLRAIDHPDEVDVGEDPLSEDSPWKTLRSDEALRAEIMQDIDRCMPDNTYFRQSRVQSMMLDILFIFCKLNPDISYRQGMHEILAPVLWVVECDAIHDPSNSVDDFVVCQICDSRFIEHDAFTLFSLVMQNAKAFYEQKAYPRQRVLSSKLATATLENPIITIVGRIFDDYLPRLDPELAKHLHDIDLAPQVFLIRWIRLLFGREFSFDDTLQIWDILFAEDPSLDLVEMISLVMLFRVRWQLLDADHNAALSILLKYRTNDDDFKPAAFALDAAALRESFNPESARKLIKKYTGREPEVRADLPDPDDFAMIDEDDVKVPSALPKSPRNFEGILQGAAKNVMSQSEKWGINKAVRDAVEEMRKGVKEIQTIPTPQAPRRHGRMQSRSSASSAQRRPDLEMKLSALQQRNEQLARMLKQTTDELWEFQKILTEEKGIEAEVVKDLSMTIARVGFAQVYLEDPSIPLPPEDTAKSSTETEEQSRRPETPSKQSDKAKDDQIASEKSLQKPPVVSTASGRQIRDDHNSQAPATPVTPRTSTPSLDPNKSRPTLAQSSFSWMLGQEERHSPLLSTAASPPRPRSRGFLFGDDEEGGATGDADALTPTRKRGKEKKVVRRSGIGATGGVRNHESEEKEDGFDLNDLRRD